MVEGELFVEVRWEWRYWVWIVWLEPYPVPLESGITASRWGAYRRANRAMRRWNQIRGKERER